MYSTAPIAGGTARAHHRKTKNTGSLYAIAPIAAPAKRSPPAADGQLLRRFSLHRRRIPPRPAAWGAVIALAEAAGRSHRTTGEPPLGRGERHASGRLSRAIVSSSDRQTISCTRLKRTRPADGSGEMEATCWPPPRRAGVFALARNIIGRSNAARQSAVAKRRDAAHRRPRAFGGVGVVPW